MNGENDAVYDVAARLADWPGMWTGRFLHEDDPVLAQDFAALTREGQDAAVYRAVSIAASIERRGVAA